MERKLDLEGKIDLLLNLQMCSYKRVQAADNLARAFRIIEDTRGDKDVSSVIEECQATISEMDTEFVRCAGVYKHHLRAAYPEIYKA